MQEVSMLSEVFPRDSHLENLCYVICAHKPKFRLSGKEAGVEYAREEIRADYRRFCEFSDKALNAELESILAGGSSIILSAGVIGTLRFFENMTTTPKFKVFDPSYYWMKFSNEGISSGSISEMAKDYVASLDFILQDPGKLIVFSMLGFACAVTLHTVLKVSDYLTLSFRQTRAKRELRDKVVKFQNNYNFKVF